MAPWYLFDSIIREVGSTNVALEYSLLEANGEGLDEEETQFKCFDRFCIWGLGNVQHQGYGKTRWRDPLSGAR